MNLPPVFYTVVSEYDGFTDNPLCWEQFPLRATRAQAELDRADTPSRYGRTWIVECRVLAHTQRHPSDDSDD